MTKYAFIDGGFVDAMVRRTSEYFATDLSLNKIDYRAIAGGHQRTFYYDALPAKKDKESDEDYELRVRKKREQFELVNRTPFMHVREGLTRGQNKTLRQKGVDILLAIDVFKHATSGHMSEAHIMTKDLDFFPLFEALRDTPVAVHLHCYPAETSNELMALADVVVPVNPFKVLQWMHHQSRDSYVEWNISIGDVNPQKLFIVGNCEELDFYIYQDDGMPFFGRAMAYNPSSLMRSNHWEHIVDDFEARVGKRVYLDQSAKR
ncbi:NYN domain-containing protein [Bradyrhizobium sp. NBAIM08]|uniref:NYN domain-containing protein n=1 Tax=Bradyrhizobium sp. NBAIM08 TaxID=2793815 RepID=UPI001CD7C1B9|nr:NYN domain-containing protein [Bradyrhizobium sp. NBAIM08]